jgi:hypothetical protein
MDKVRKKFDDWAEKWKSRINGKRTWGECLKF